MKVNDIRERAERPIAIAGAACAALAGAALIVGFYAAFQDDRFTFWIWFAGFAVLLAGDILLGRITGIRSMARMTNMYVSFGVPHPRSRARIAVTFAQFPVPLLVLAFLYIQVWSSVVSLTREQPLVPIAALLAAACGAVVKERLTH